MVVLTKISLTLVALICIFNCQVEAKKNWECACLLPKDAVKQGLLTALIPTNPSWFDSTSYKDGHRSWAIVKCGFGVQINCPAGFGVVGIGSQTARVMCENGYWVPGNFGIFLGPPPGSARSGGSITNSLCGMLSTPPQNWSYRNMSAWPLLYPLCGDHSQRQSPIPLSLDTTVTNPDLTTDPLVLTNYNQIFTGQLMNNRRIQWNTNTTLYTPAQMPQISGSGLGGTYILSQFHFHLGTKHEHCEGSEHVIEYSRGVAEMHFVHYNSKYPSFAIANVMPDGIAYVGFQIKIDDVLADCNKTAGFLHLAKNVFNIQAPASAVPFTVDFSKLMPNIDGLDYFRYLGASTKPPCTENVIMTIFKDPIFLTEQTGKHFLDNARRLEIIELDGLTVDIGRNWRNLQNRQARTVWVTSGGTAQGFC